MEQFDLAIIGGGPAGYLAAERASEAGLKTLLIEKREVGGVCLNEGCIPTKTLLHSAKLYQHTAKDNDEFGISGNNSVLHHDRVIKRKQEVIQTLVDGVKTSLKKHKVKIVYAEASLFKEATGFKLCCDAESYLANYVLLATGSEPIIPNIKGINEGLANTSILTSREILKLTEVPKNLVILGAGVIGLEMAAYFQNAGSQVSVIEMMDQIGGAIDQDAAFVLQKNLESLGIKFYLNSKVFDLSNQCAHFEKDKEETIIPYDKVLISVGRKPALSVPGLDKIGLQIEKDAVITDNTCATNIPGLFAAGDINGKYMLAHVAYRETEVAINNILGQKDIMDYTAVPGVIYTQPELAFAGLSEQQAIENGIEIITKKESINHSGRHIAEHGLSSGFIKLVIDKKKNIIIGATLLSAYASEIIYSLVLMIQNKIPIENIKRTIFPHPTVSEIIKEALFS